jgi:HPt (histidine-containing phosphotransfer) domain-containing protein
MPEATSGLDNPASDGLLLDDELVRELVGDLGAAEFDNLVAIFDQDLTRRIGDLREAIAAADMLLSRRILHAMAGSAASIGAAALAAHCRSRMHAADLAATTADDLENRASATCIAFGRHRHAWAGAIG